MPEFFPVLGSVGGVVAPLQLAWLVALGGLSLLAWLTSALSP